MKVLCLRCEQQCGHSERRVASSQAWPRSSVVIRLGHGGGRGRFLHVPRRQLPLPFRSDVGGGWAIIREGGKSLKLRWDEMRVSFYLQQYNIGQIWSRRNCHFPSLQVLCGHFHFVFLPSQAFEQFPVVLWLFHPKIGLPPVHWSSNSISIFVLPNIRDKFLEFVPSKSLFVSEMKMEMELDNQWTGGMSVSPPHGPPPILSIAFPPSVWNLKELWSPRPRGTRIIMNSWVTVAVGDVMRWGEHAA